MVCLTRKELESNALASNCISSPSFKQYLELSLCTASRVQTMPAGEAKTLALTELLYTSGDPYSVIIYRN